MQGVVISSAANEKDIWSNQAKSAKIRPIVVTPSPSDADKRRQKLNDWNLTESFDVVTVAKFLSLKLDSREEVKSTYKLLRKSEILLHLGFIYKNTHPSPTLLNFENSYKWFSELRSFSVDYSVLASIIESLPSEFAQSMSIFQYYFETNNILDEHFAFQLLSKECESFFSQDEEIIFSDFTNLTGVQIDLVKNLIGQNIFHIIIPDVYLDYKNNFDWINWLGISSDNKRESGRTPSFRIYEYSKGSLQNYLDKLFDAKKYNKVVFLNGEDIYQEHVTELSNHFFKNPIDLFHDVIDIYFKELLKRIENEKVTQFSLLQMIEADLRAELKNKSPANYLYYRKIKIIQLIKSILVNLETLVASEIEIDPFVLSLFEKIVKLDAPRANIIPLIEIEGPELMEQRKMKISDSSNNFVAFSEDFSSSLTSSELPFTLTQKLSLIGPLKNKAFEMANFIYNLSFPTSGETILLIPENYKEFSPYLDKFMKDSFLKEIQKSLIDINTSNNERDKNDDPLDKIVFENINLLDSCIKSFSLSAIKTYKDCPRKYFFNNILRFDKRVDVDDSLTPAQLGEVEHATIGAFCKSFLNAPDFEDELFKLADTNISKYLEKKKIFLNDSEKFKALNEVYNYSLSAIFSIRKIISAFPSPILHFELPFVYNLPSLKSVKGRIDCVLEFPDFVIILDFKRSKAATKTDIVNLSDFQIGTYVLATPSILNKKVFAFNYIVLNNDSHSLLRFNDANSTEVTDIKIECLKITEDEYQTKLTSNLDETLEFLKKDNKYLPTPSSEACLYCNLKSVCKRGLL